MSAAATSETILVFDSGLGGLTVYREIAAVRPGADFIYVADDAAFPYGAIAEPELVARVVALMDELIAAHRPDLIVIACNTASTIVLPDPETNFAAIRRHRACDQARLCELRQPAYCRARHRSNNCPGIYPRVNPRLRGRLPGDPGRIKRLAAYAEAQLAGAPVTDEAIYAEIAPCFRDDGARTDTVVLACTHYPLLIDRLRRLAPWPVAFLDPAPAIARRVNDLLGPAPSPARPGTTRAIFTSGRPPRRRWPSSASISAQRASTGAADQFSRRRSLVARVR